jgi:hypothetical protein
MRTKTAATCLMASILNFASQARAQDLDVISVWAYTERAATLTISGQFGPGLPLLDQTQGSSYPNWPQNWSNETFSFSTPLSVTTTYTGLGFNQNLQSFQLLSSGGCNSTGMAYNVWCSNYFLVGGRGTSGGNNVHGGQWRVNEAADTVSINVGVSDEFGAPGAFRAQAILPLSQSARLNAKSFRSESYVNYNGIFIQYGDYLPAWALYNGVYHFDDIDIQIRGDNLKGAYFNTKLYGVTVTIQNGVPEPDIWIGLIVGFIGTGIVARRIRVKLT